MCKEPDAPERPVPVVPGMGEHLTKTIGFTGPRAFYHEHLVSPYLAELDAHTYVTGGAIGLDTYAGMALAHKYPHARHVVIAPANHAAVSYWWLGEEYVGRVIVHQMRHGTTYKARNEAIVRASTELMAFPLYVEHDPRSERSGTWQTVRIARRRDIPVSVRVLEAPVPA